MWSYIEKIRDEVDQLAHRVIRAQKNLATIIKIVEQWSDVPLFQRQENKKENLLVIDDAVERVSKKYVLICKM